MSTENSSLWLLQKGVVHLEEIALFLMNFSASILPHVLAVITALVAGVLLLVLRRKIVSLLCRVLKKLTAHFSGAADIIDAAQRPAVAFLTVLAVYLFASILQTHFWPGAGKLAAFLLMALKISLIVCITWAAMDATGPVVSAIQGSKSTLDKTLVLFLSKILKVILLALSVIIIMDEVGYNISGLITGLGLGGLTFALAAQDTASNLFGGVVIIADKPFQVGDWIQADSLEGVVSDITLRSTHIRTFKDAEIIVPNSVLANASIINWSRMNKRKVEMTLGVTYQTSREQLQQADEAIRKILREHPRVDPDVIIVAFNEFAAYSLDLTVAYFTKDTAFADYIAVKEDINFRIMDALASLGVEFAYPTQTLLMESAAPKEKEEA